VVIGQHIKRETVSGFVGGVVLRVAIYCRVSTDQQELEQQIQKCIDYCNLKDWTHYDVFREIKSSVKERPVFKEVLKKCRQHQYSHLVVFRIDRTWRRSRDFIMDFDSLQSNGITIVSVMEGLDQSTAIGKAMMTIIVVLAELERNFISEATKQRLEALKNLGRKLGRPKGSKDKVKRSNTGYLLREAKKRGNKNLVEKYQGEIESK
jgi:DNA invertase Pin-like site-specific DNA recombinase